jgi:VWFA-related protein
LTLLFCAGSLSAQKPAAPAFSGETVEVNVVNVEAHVTDKQGNRVTDLRREDFQLFDDGKPVKVDYFEVVVPKPAVASPAARAEGTESAAGEPAPTGAASAEPLNLVIYVDNTEIKPANRARVLRQLDEFLSGQLGPGDRVLIATNDLGGLHVRLPFTSDPAVLSAALGKLKTLAVHGDETDRSRRLALEAMMTLQEESLSDPVDPVPCPQNIVTPAHGFASVRRQDVLRTLGALTVMVNSLSGMPGPKALLHVSDGLPITPGEELFEFLFQLCGGSGGTAGLGAHVGQIGGQQDPALTVHDAMSFGPQSYQASSQAPMDAQGYSISKNLDTLAAHANAQRVTLYTLQASGLEGTSASDPSYGPRERLFQFASIGSVERKGRQDSLLTLAEATGGKAMINGNDFTKDLVRMRQDFSSYYSLGYNAASRGDGREHRLELKVKRPGLTVRHRRSYRDKSPGERTADRTLSALLNGVEDNPLEITVELGDQLKEENGRYLVPIKLRIPLFKLSISNHQETYEGSLRLMVVTQNDKGEISAVRQMPVPISIPRGELLTAMGQYYLYTLSLQLPPGEQRVAVGVRDERAGLASFLSRDVLVGTERGTPQHASASSDGR